MSPNSAKNNHYAAQELVKQLLVNLEQLTRSLLEKAKQGEVPEEQVLQERDRMIGILESIVDKNLAQVMPQSLQNIMSLNDQLVETLEGEKSETKGQISTNFKKKEKIKKYNLREVR